MKTEANRLLAKEVLRGTPAHEAGIAPGDELLAIDNYRLHAEQWNSTLEHYRPLDLVSILVSRRDRLVTIPVRLEAEPVRRWLLEASPEATGAQKQHLKAWLKSA